MAITQAAIKSSKLYYEYLKATGGGVSSCRVRNFGLSRKNGAQFVLFLDGAVRFIESANIRISGKDCTRHQITILEYDSKNKILIVQPRTEFFSLMVDASPNEVEVVSNLLFLIERVESWYKEYGRLLTIPKTFPLGTDALQVDSTKLSNDQISAVSNALSNRLSYIWGAPGTGKTRNVLMECVMQYFRADKQVLILAPTNNSLEQTLNGILEKLQQEEIELNGNVLRLGIASTEFYGKYPEVCEDITIARKISDLEAHIHAVNAQMDEISALINAFDEHQRVYDVSLKFDAVKNIYPSLFSKWSSLCKNIIEMQSDLPKCEVQHSEIIAKIEILSRNKEFAERKVAEDCKRVNKISNSLWEIGRKRAEKELDLSKTNLTQISIEVEQLRAKEFQLYSEIQRLSSVRESTLREENQTWEKLCCLVECIPSLTTKLRKEKSRGCEVNSPRLYGQYKKAPV